MQQDIEMVHFYQDQSSHEEARNHMSIRDEELQLATLKDFLDA